MSRKLGLLSLTLLVAVSLVAGISSVSMAEEAKTPTAPAVTVAPAGMVYEIEDFTIENGKIVEDKAASNGKSVIANDFTFKAKKTIAIKQAGIYQLTIFENAPNGGVDAINVQINEDGGAVRTYPNTPDYGTYAPCSKKVVFTVSQPGDIVVIVFTSNEAGAFYDKITLEMIKAL